MDHLPGGWTYSYRASLSGVYIRERKHIEAPKPVTRRALQVWLHECAHAHNIGKGEKRQVEEMMAEQWSYAPMREAGVPVPRKSTNNGKRHIANRIDMAVRRGAKKIDAEAMAFARKR